MDGQMARFPKNEIICLIGEMPRYDLGESTGPELFSDFPFEADLLR